MADFKRIGQTIATVAVVGTGAAAQTITEQDIRTGYLEHAALAQFHRWYQYYERNEGGIDNAMDILADDVFVSSSSGEANGAASYKERVAAIPSTWKNAHLIRSVDVTVNADGTTSLDAKITYLNEGMMADGAVVSADLSYATTLAPSNGLLPSFKSIVITQDTTNDPEPFQDAYAENRALSAIHYYLAIIEDPVRDPAPAEELFAPEFSLNFSSGAITDFDGFQEWLAGPASTVAASTHEITEITVTSADDTQLNVDMTFDWAGIMPDGTRLIAQTRHKWVMTNDVTERFARIMTVDVEVLKPFQPAPAE